MLINVIGVVLVLIAVVGFATRKGRQTTEGPKELTELFDPQIKSRKRFPTAIRKEVTRYACQYGAVRAVERYADLDVTYKDIVRWMKQK